VLLALKVTRRPAGLGLIIASALVLLIHLVFAIQNSHPGLSWFDDRWFTVLVAALSAYRFSLPLFIGLASALARTGSRISFRRGLQIWVALAIAMFVAEATWDPNFVAWRFLSQLKASVHSGAIFGAIVTAGMTRQLRNLRQLGKTFLAFALLSAAFAVCEFMGTIYWLQWLATRFFGVQPVQGCCGPDAVEIIRMTVNDLAITWILFLAVCWRLRVSKEEDLFVPILAEPDERHSPHVAPR
jgi:hypothetical protein